MHGRCPEALPVSMELVCCQENEGGARAGGRRCGRRWGADGDPAKLLSTAAPAMAGQLPAAEGSGAAAAKANAQMSGESLVLPSCSVAGRPASQLPEEHHTRLMPPEAAVFAGMTPGGNTARNKAAASASQRPRWVRERRIGIFARIDKCRRRERAPRSLRKGRESVSAAGGGFPSMPQECENAQARR